MASIELDDLENVFYGIVEDFIDECEEDVKKAVREVGKEAAEKLKTETPAGAGRYHDWGAYQQGWTATTKATDLDSAEVIIHNTTKPGLTHLLERGHVNADGKTRAKAFKHIEPVAEEAMEDLLRRLTTGE